MNKDLSITSQKDKGVKIREAIKSGIEEDFFLKLDDVINEICTLIIGDVVHNDIRYKTIGKVITTQFNDFSLEELLEAFYMHVGGKLQFDDTYHAKMSGGYIRGVLLAYREKRNKKELDEIKRWQQEESKEGNSFDENENEKVSFNTILKAFESSKKLPDYGSNIYLQAYSYADKNNIFNFKKEEKISLLDSERRKIKKLILEFKEKRSSVGDSMVIFYKRFLENEGLLINHCKVELFKKWILEKEQK